MWPVSYRSCCCSIRTTICTWCSIVVQISIFGNTGCAITKDRSLYAQELFWAKSMPVSIRKIMILTSSLCQESSFWQRLNAKTRLLLLTTVYLSTELAPGLFRYGYRLLLAQATGCSLGSKIRHGVLGIGLV